MKFFFLLIIFLCSKILVGQQPIIYSTDACGDTYTGTLEILFTHDINIFSLPYIGSFYNKNNGDFEDIIIDSTTYRIDSLFPGEYEFVLEIGVEEIMEFCVTVENNGVGFTHSLISTLTHPCESLLGSLNIEVEDGNHPYVLVLNKVENGNNIEIYNIPNSTGIALFENLNDGESELKRTRCCKRYRYFAAIMEKNKSLPVVMLSSQKSQKMSGLMIR